MPPTRRSTRPRCPRSTPSWSTTHGESLTISRATPAGSRHPSGGTAIGGTTATGTRDRIDWRAERDRVVLVEVAIDLLGPAPGRRGERGRKLWWNCPFHDDPNPSSVIDPVKPWWKCWGCGEHGDAASLVMRL